MLLEHIVIREHSDYQVGHTAPGPEFGCPLSKLNANYIYPDDVYSSKGKRIYTTMPEEEEAWDVAVRLKDKPDAELTIYRAIPTKIDDDEIHEGDWVAITKSYAVLHGDGPLKGDYKILTKKVKAIQVWTNGDSLAEWGYWPDATVDDIQDEE